VQASIENQTVQLQLNTPPYLSHSPPLASFLTGDGPSKDKKKDKKKENDGKEVALSQNVSRPL